MLEASINSKFGVKSKNIHEPMAAPMIAILLNLCSQNHQI